MEIKREVKATARDLLDRLTAVSQNVAKVGWTEGKRYPDKPYPLVAAIAAENEFGTFKVPSRPFLRMTIAAKYTEWLATMAAGARSMLRGGSTFEHVLFAVGNNAVSDIRRTVANRVPPPLSPVTIAIRVAKKKRNKLTATLDLPLNDTGYMLATLNNVIEPE